MPLIYKDIKTGQATYAKPEKNFPEQIKTLKDGLDTVFGRTDVNEQELGETVGQMQVALDGITELYDELVTTQDTLAQTNNVLTASGENLKAATSNIKVLTRANAELSDELENAKIALDEANGRIDTANEELEAARLELKQTGDAILELFDLMVMG